MIKLKGTRYIIFDSLKINASAGTYGYGVQLMGNTDSNVVKNCTITLSTTSTTQDFAGIVVNGSDAGPVSTGTVLSDYNEFTGNTITGGYYGITLVGSFNNGANGNNKIIGNIIKDFYSYGIYVAEQLCNSDREEYHQLANTYRCYRFLWYLFHYGKKCGLYY